MNYKFILIVKISAFASSALLYGPQPSFQPYNRTKIRFFRHPPKRQKEKPPFPSHKQQKHSKCNEGKGKCQRHSHLDHPKRQIQKLKNEKM
ncbi:MAG: hypothetical protein Q4A50_10305, partial [Bacteroidales bacterium]|nr:hypothetical protein [Bacteroidales bacterium]